jgi:galactokinase
MNTKTQQLLEKFKAAFGGQAKLYRAPGRVNLIGEHTDYNDGFVLPAAIGFSCWAAAGPRNDGKISIHSENFGAGVETATASDSLRPRRDWSDYPVGVVWALSQAGLQLSGANVYLQSDVPLGAGLSSSAAVEIATGLALLDTSGQSVDKTRLALLCQKAENDFVGARCGIMDQFVSCHGRAGHALLLDCRSLEHRLLPIPKNIHLVICNTMVRHELGAGEYNVRRAECEEAVKILSTTLPAVRALRDVSLAELEARKSALRDNVYRRSRHVITENDRVQKTAAALAGGDLPSLEQLTAESHRSLKNDFEVSCAELDIMVDLANAQKGVYGARMTGGGFGGCTINFVDSRNSSDFQSAVAAGYHAATGRWPDIYICGASDGAEAIDLALQESRN